MNITHRQSNKPGQSRPLLLVALLGLIVGIVLMAINIYGLTQPIRKPGLGVTELDQLRFAPETVWSYEESLAAIDNLDMIEKPERLAKAANQAVNQSLVHVKWNHVDPVEYRQLVPIWENYFLWGIGKFSGLPQFERYHYTDYHRNIRRGIGICGDASTILSSVMDRYDLDNRIISFRGHVIVEYQADDGRSHLFDPDFGIDLGVTLQALLKEPSLVREEYRSAEYSKREIDNILAIYETEHKIFESTYHFMSKRYLFEQFSYIAKWLLPIFMIMLPLLFLGWNRYKRT